MKNKLPSCPSSGIAAWAWLLALGALAAASVAAQTITVQNFVKNPDFEEPLGTNNWIVVYTNVFGGGNNQPTNSCANDFLFAGRSTMAHKDLNPGTWDGEDHTGTNYWSKFGGHFAPNHNWMMHGYFSQVVKGLTANVNYTISAWMAFYGGNDDYTNKCDIYLEVMGGRYRTTSKTTPYPLERVMNCNNHPENWRKYSMTHTASANGELEVRLHFNKFDTTSYWEWRNFNAYYDHVAVYPAGQTEYVPPYKILSCIRSNQDLTLTWQSSMNNSYRIQYTRDFSGDPEYWPFVRWSPKLDTNLYATGTNFTFKTNLACLFSSDPTYDPAAPLFFRIRSFGYRP